MANLPDLSSPEALDRFLRSQKLHANKSLGQHFLCSREVVDAICDAAGSVNSVLEIGPGPGILTGPLSLRFAKVVALEVDPRMPAALRISAPTAEVLMQDALKSDLAAILGAMPEPRGIVSNLPYYITSSLLQKMAEAKDSISVAVLMMQKEVAARIMAPAGSGDRGSLSVYLQALFNIERIIEAPAALFVPPPKVDSTVLRFTPMEGAIPDEQVFDFIRKGFGNPRKTLANVLSATLRVDREVVLNQLQALGLKPTARAQELRLDDWNLLYDKLG